MVQPAENTPSFPLFRSFDPSQARWDKILALRDDSAAGRAFQHLLRWKAPATRLADPDVAGLDYRRRIHELRQLGVPVVNKPISGKPYDEYSLPPEFVAEYWRRRRSA
jgi:hypothetical protein